MTLKPEILSIETSIFLKQMSFLKSFNSVLYMPIQEFSVHSHVPYSFGHKVEVGGRVFPLKQPERSTNVYPSSMMDLDFSFA